MEIQPITPEVMKKLQSERDSGWRLDTVWGSNCSTIRIFYHPNDWLVPVAMTVIKRL